jgi:hypothetical protein
MVKSQAPPAFPPILAFFKKFPLVIHINICQNQPMSAESAIVAYQSPTRKMPKAFFARTRQSGNQAIRQSGNQAIRQSGNQAIRQSGNQAIRQSGNQAIIHTR